MKPGGCPLLDSLLFPVRKDSLIPYGKIRTDPQQGTFRQLRQGSSGNKDRQHTMQLLSLQHFIFLQRQQSPQRQNKSQQLPPHVMHLLSPAEL